VRERAADVGLEALVRERERERERQAEESDLEARDIGDQGVVILV